jgi:tRNA G18 (ribose-2'-O)-methylase SpoU
MLHRIGSADDPRLDPYRHVGDSAWLEAKGLFVAEGRLVVERLLEQTRFVPRSVLVTPAASEALHDRLAAAPCDAYVCDQQIVNGITGFNFHRGCLALAERPIPHAVETLLERRLLVGLEGVGNPDNVGGLFRTASAFGVDGIVLDGASGDPLYRKAVRTSMGAALRVPYARIADWPAAAQTLRRAHFTIVALTPSPGAIPIATFAGNRAADARLVLLAGSEGSGLGNATLDAADVRVRIPIAANVDSLNVVVAAGVALAHLVDGMMRNNR